VNSADYTDVPRSAIFSVFGASFSDSVVQAAALPLKTTLNGVTVQITAGTFHTAAPLLYVSPSQINAILPSSVPEGNNEVTVIPSSGPPVSYPSQSLRVDSRHSPKVRGDSDLRRSSSTTIQDSPI